MRMAGAALAVPSPRRPASQAGDLLGYVGSSGFSDVPHLHFEVRDSNGVVIDPWVGACGAGESRWSQQLGYQEAFSMYASGLSKASLTLDLVKDPPPQASVFSTTDPHRAAEHAGTGRARGNGWRLRGGGSGLVA